MAWRVIIAAEMVAKGLDPGRVQTVLGAADPAVFRPDSDNWMAARSPAPPAPTITASNLRTVTAITASTEFEPPNRRSR